MKKLLYNRIKEKSGLTTTQTSYSTDRMYFIVPNQDGAIRFGNYDSYCYNWSRTNYRTVDSATYGMVGITITK